MNHKIIVGMSGGVDSSIAAMLLKKEGYNIEGLFMKNWDDDFETNNFNKTTKKHGCNVTQDLIDAEAVCLKLGIKLHTVNFSKEYWDHVFYYFLEEYKAYRTPNPDVLCNKEIKFKAFLEHACSLGAEKIATGHYARIKQTKNGYYQLLKGLDQNKDQSYFLYLLNQQALASSLFPLGDLTKTDVRKLASEANFPNYAKKDSTGICFIGERKFKEFLSQYLPAQPGLIETPEGQVIGKHDGLMYYTIGQRQGLHIGGVKNRKEAPWYVAQKDVKRNVLIAVQEHDHPLLYTAKAIIHQIHWVDNTFSPVSPFRCAAKTRYRQSDRKCTLINLKDKNAEVVFDIKERAVTPGQSIVFYDGDICLGGAIIQEARLT